MNSFKLQMMASDHMVYDGDALSLTLPTTEGRVGILAQHSNLIMAIVPGIAEFKPLSSGQEETQAQQWVVSDGLLKVENGDVLVLVDTAERPEDIDEARAVRAAERAREELRQANTNRDHVLLEAELSRAMSRIKASKKKHKL